MAPISAMSGIYPQLELTLDRSYAMLYVSCSLHFFDNSLITVEIKNLRKKGRTFIFQAV